jgi:hypothetical protein
VGLAPSEIWLVSPLAVGKIRPKVDLLTNKFEFGLLEATEQTYARVMPSHDWAWIPQKTGDAVRQRPTFMPAWYFKCSDQHPAEAILTN